jgi:hypothetical protein
MIDEYKNAREALFEDAFNKEFGRIEDYRFKGFNHALGCFVESKDHYKVLLKRKGLLPSDAAERIAEESKSRAEKAGNKELSQESQEIINAIRRCRKKSDGTIELGGRLIEAMVKIKAIGNDNSYTPNDCLVGGYS